MKIGIIGAGAIAKRGHLPVIRFIDNVEVTAIADIDEKLAREVAAEFGIKKVFNNSNDLFSDKEVELVDICTPTGTHAELIQKAITERKHVLVEKPLAGSLSEALNIHDQVKNSGIKLCVVQNYRYFDSILKTKNRIANGYLGKITSVHGWGLQPFPSRWTLNKWLYHYGGTLYDFGPHVIDLLLYLFDFPQIRSVYALGGDISGGNMDFINYSTLLIEFETGVTASLDISWVTGLTSKFSFNIAGTGGGIDLDIKTDMVVETHGFPTPIDDTKTYLTKMFKITKGVVTGNFFHGANKHFMKLIMDFISCIEGCGEIPVPVEQGLATNSILEAAVLSIKEKKPVYIQELVQKTKNCIHKGI